MLDLSVQLREKIGVAEACLKQTNVQIYNFEINLRVAKIADDEKMMDSNKTEMARQLKIKDGYENILKELKALQKREKENGTNQSGICSKEKA